jgi:hypothetical protein
MTISCWQRPAKDAEQVIEAEKRESQDGVETEDRKAAPNRPTYERK